MKTRKFILTAISLFCVINICAQSHFIGDTNYYNHVLKDLQSKEKALPNGNFFDILNRKELSVYDKEALSFLYAYLPESDIVDKSGDYYLENIHLTQKALKEMPWGKDIDESLVRHFVLPIRVNNEPLDDARKVFYDALKERIKNLSISQAILEVNHWCHEHVMYTPSDARTSSPLQTLRTAYGRCGEESTFCVAALRSVGIPARQVYTPRWAHTDDNHAWVEVWADGAWHFLGACEPEPVLDLAWFNAPASRAMLVHTKVFGNYQGKEEVIIRKPNYTEINVVSTYTKTSRMDIHVVDGQGKAVKDAKVEFKVYNYAEFYTMATKYTDSDGNTFLSSGHGDMMLWASRDGKWGYSKITFGKELNKTIVLDHSVPSVCSEDFDIVPPNEDCTLPEVSKEMRAENDRRLSYEDSVRNLYVATMFTKESANKWCLDNGLDSTLASRILVLARGNHPVITKFILNHKADERLALNMLASISQKDVRDVPLSVLESHFSHIAKPVSSSDSGMDYLRYCAYCPRVELEALTPYKEYFQKELPDAQKQEWSSPTKFIEWIKQNITLNEDLNVTSVPVSPEGVWKSHVADVRSRDIFFASVLLSLGVTARIDPVTSKPQYKQDGKWIDANFGTQLVSDSAKGTLYASYTPTAGNANPSYYTHFTISKFNNGVYELLNYGEGDTYQSLFRNGLKLDVGHYMMVTGNRQPDGSTLTHVVFFDINEGKDTHIELKLRAKAQEYEVIGNLPAEVLKDYGCIKDGWYVCAVLGVGQEPTNHALRDMGAMKDELNKTGIPMLFLCTSEKLKDNCYKEFGSLFNGCQNLSWAVDKDNKVQNSMVSALNLKNKKQLPIVVIANSDGRVVFLSQGYTIGLGEQLTKVIRTF